MQDKAEIQPPPPGRRPNPLDGGFKFSASQIGTQRDCFTKWYLDQTLGLPRGDTNATLLGKKIHSELEGWLKNKEPPKNPRAKALIPLLPLPSDKVLVEHEFRLLTPPGVVRGFMDVFIPNVWGVDMPFATQPDPAVPVVMDHKTTSNLFYAKSSQDLLTDPQAVLYGMAARVFRKEAGGEIPENVDLIWNYVQTRGEAETKQARLRQSLQIMEDGLGPIIEEASSMRKALVADVKAEDLPHNLKACEKFGGCQFMDYCPHFKKVISMSDTQEPVESATLARLRKAREAARAKPQTDVAPTEATPPATKTEKPAPAAITPEPKLEAIPTEKVAPPAEPVAVLPPDAPAPKARSKKPAADAAPTPGPLEDLKQLEEITRRLAHAAIDTAQVDNGRLASITHAASTLLHVLRS
jgi:hypothetical protein